MKMTSGMWPGFELSVESNDELVHPGGSELNPDWRFVDAEGHGHFVSEDKTNRLPTLAWMSEPCTMGHADCDAEGHYECRTCGEEIQPGTRDARPFMVRGAPTYTLDVFDQTYRTRYVFGRDEWEALTSAVSEVVADVLANNMTHRTQVGPVRT